MADYGKLTLALFLVGFWLFLPIPMMYLDVTGYNTLNPETESKTVIGKAISFGDKILSAIIPFYSQIMEFATMYTRLLFFNIPNVSPILKYFLNFLQIATLVFIVFFLKEG